MEHFNQSPKSFSFSLCYLNTLAGFNSAIFNTQPYVRLIILKPTIITQLGNLARLPHLYPFFQCFVTNLFLFPCLFKGYSLSLFTTFRPSLVSDRIFSPCSFTTNFIHNHINGSKDFQCLMIQQYLENTFQFTDMFTFNLI